MGGVGSCQQTVSVGERGGGVNRLMTSPGFDSNAHQLASLLQPLDTRLVWLLAEG